MFLCIHVKFSEKDGKCFSGPAVILISQHNSTPTTVLGYVDVHSELWHFASWEIGHAGVGGHVSELHVHNFQTAGARRHVRVAAQQDQAVRVEDRRAVLVPGVVDLVLRGGVHVARQLQVPAHLDGFAVLVGVWRDLEGQIGHRCIRVVSRGREESGELGC